jgi:hypothetical protein
VLDGHHSHEVAPVEAYETINIHYVNDWKLTSKVLQTETLPVSHTGQNRDYNLDRAMAEWNLSTSKISALTHKNASCMNSACEVAESVDNIHIPCFPHTINLAAQKANETLKDVTQFMAPIITYFRKSSTVGLPVLKQKLRKACSYPGIISSQR